MRLETAQAIIEGNVKGILQQLNINEATRGMGTTRRIQEYANSILSQLKVLQEEIERNQLDTKRLDYLETKHEWHIGFSSDPEEDSLELCSVEGSRNDRDYILRGQGGTIRQAIDQALGVKNTEAKDNELIVLSAHAINLDITIENGGICKYQNMPAPPVVWNPLKYDVDAFKLITNLNMTVKYDTLPDGAIVKVGLIWHEEFKDYYWNEWLKNDAAAATRRAITRAAADLERWRKGVCPL